MHRIHVEVKASNYTKKVGYIEYTPKGKVLDIDYVQSYVEKEGVSTAAFGEMLRRQPQAQIIVTRLSMDNKSIAQGFLDQGMSCIDALKETPAYKVRAKFGFTKILNASCPQYNHFVLDVAKPQ